MKKSIGSFLLTSSNMWSPSRSFNHNQEGIVDYLESKESMKSMLHPFRIRTSALTSYSLRMTECFFSMWVRGTRGGQFYPPTPPLDPYIRRDLLGRIPIDPFLQYHFLCCGWKNIQNHTTKSRYEPLIRFPFPRPRPWARHY